MLLEPSQVPSPCRNVCRLERRICVGCGRTPDEIARWPTASDPERRAIRAAAAARLPDCARRR
ncbi:DUF1289 domain-containing protein [Thermaurantiacus tibetensis]|uniref:DUF1289 domain-containing protein n=1 Tax=Thermaurantiacus tibetensis TaxID=2759035 RepID=UPI00188F6064|nr:DUF1289 domain-containing protein [Thermaurantiacus tibetensis]